MLINYWLQTKWITGDGSVDADNGGENEMGLSQDEDLSNVINSSDSIDKPNGKSFQLVLQHLKWF